MRRVSGGAEGRVETKQVVSRRRQSCSIDDKALNLQDRKAVSARFRSDLGFSMFRSPTTLSLSDDSRGSEEGACCVRDNQNVTRRVPFSTRCRYY